MIRLYAHNSQTFYEGDQDALEQYLYPALRIEDKNSYWKARAALRRMAYFYGTEEEREAKKEEIIEASQWIKFYDGRSKSFLTGLLPRVLKALEKQGALYDVQDSRTKFQGEFLPIKKFSFLDEVEKRPEQISAVNKALKAKRGILHCATNFGKTEVAAGVIAQYIIQVPDHRISVLFLVHRIQLVKQTAERFRNHLNVPVYELGGGEKKIPKDGVLVATVQTATNVLKQLGSFLDNCDILFVDEFHVNKAWACSKVAKVCAAPMRFGLSGTISKESEAKMMHYVGMTGPVVAEVRNEELVNLGRSARPIARFIEVDTGKIPKRSGYSAAYNYGIVRNFYRNKLVVSEIMRHLDKDRKVLVTVARINHGNILRDMLNNCTDLRTEFLQGSTPVFARDRVLKNFQRGRVSVIIASPIFDTGVDIPEGVDAWVNAAGGIGWELVLQRLGRVLRRKKKGENKVYVSDFVDRHSVYLLRHSMARIRHYLNEKIVEIKIVEAV